MEKVFYVNDPNVPGKRHKAIYYANSSGNWIEFYGKDAPPPQAVVSRDSYAYTHGGALYQAAIDKFEMTAQARERLEDLELPESLLLDESGQTSEDDHHQWLATAPTHEILIWAKEVQNV
jgi:hypothetical protein